MENGKNGIVIKVNAHNRAAYVEALDAVLLSRCDALDADATWESVMHLREQLAGKRFEYPGQQDPSAPGVDQET